MSDYLWDRSGEPDKEIQELEELLAPLGYQPRPLEIPLDVKIEPRRRFAPALAIAATIALAALALGLWFAVKQSANLPPSKAKATVPQQNDAPAPLQSPTVQKAPSIELAKDEISPGVLPEKAVPKRVPRRERQAPIQPSNREAIARNDAEVGEAAKEQLMTALRLVSTKLNHAQKKAQSGYPENQVRNHKVG